MRRRESVEAYVARKKAKGTFGTPKPYRFHKGKRTDKRGVQVLTGICPCKECGHEGQPMILCDPDYHDCECCGFEVCS